MTIVILGRQPRLALAELEAIFGKDCLQPLGTTAALIKVDPHTVDHARLGGTIKIARLLATLPTANWNYIASYVTDTLPKDFDNLPDGKLTLGLSTYDLRTTTQQLQRVALELKKLARSTGRSARVVPNKELALNSAQVLHNHLVEPLGMELLLVSDREQTYVAQTISIQNLESYALRDFSRPKRDAFVGMLPPKLAQMMINLAHPAPNTTILDPFCGTGVILMEAALQNYVLAGSDLNQKMIDYTSDNLRWLGATYHINPSIQELIQADATTYTWQKPIDTVVTETYLGQPLSGIPKQQKLSEIVQTCDHITRAFLVNLRRQLNKNARCTIAVPAWRHGNHFIHLPVVDDLKKIGYNRVSFSYAKASDLIYHRPDQIVARELLVIKVK